MVSRGMPKSSSSSVSKVLGRVKLYILVFLLLLFYLSFYSSEFWITIGHVLFLLVRVINALFVDEESFSCDET